MSLDLYGITQLAFLLAFVGLSAWATLTLRRSRKAAWVLGQGAKRRVQGWAERGFGGGLILWLGLILLHGLGLAAKWLPSRLADPLWTLPGLRGLGLVLLPLAWTLNLLGLRGLGDNWRVGVDTERPGRLVTRGIYRYCRNPIMVCFFLYASSVALTWPSTLLVFAWALITVSIHFQVRSEERFLRRLHGEAYERYCARVGRYLPRVRGEAGPREA